MVTVLLAVIGTETALVFVSWLASGRTRRLRCWASITVGVKSSRIPTSLHATVIVAMPFAADPATGTGNSPPARKLAGCPEVAVKLGSARIVISPSCARASTVRLVRADFGPNAKLIAFWTEIWPPVVGLFVTKVVLPLIFVQLTPRAFSTVRSTSAIFTCRLTWLGVATDIWLITLLLLSLAIAAANAFAFSARPAVETFPFKRSDPFTDSTFIFSPGTTCRNDSRKRDKSC